jgi:hypothetical protein
MISQERAFEGVTAVLNKQLGWSRDILQSAEFEFRPNIFSIERLGNNYWYKRRRTRRKTSKGMFSNDATTKRRTPLRPPRAQKCID